MFANKSTKYPLTLVVSLVLILSLLPVSEASDFQPVLRRSHGLIKKRLPLGPLIGAAPDPKTADTASSSSSSSGSSAVLSSSSRSSSSASSSTPSASASVISSASKSSSTSSATSSSSSSSSSTSTTSAPSLTSSSSVPNNTNTSESLKVTQPGPDEVVVVETNSAGNQVTVTQTTANAAQTDAQKTQAGATASHNKAKSTALTVLIVIASSVGAVLLFWTIFRKWKLARSSKFDQRLEPINWQPTNSDEGIIPANRRRNSTASSFRSGYGATSGAGHAGSDHGHRLDVPDHDFTAGPAPVGGYADLARGPSPQPMQQLGRGPSLTRPNYDVGVPLHHQAPYGGRY
ncbi:hypothetical protein E1B28_000914 [Marasmius oreades]|uniref:Mid2 domain-containing protein n=1 Tax=Marasmius oreades TaxID=181124 RepID=A0A9P7V2F1_9AGAR|nr:uncharacterized protein E1B28_000914 [Marasmius oreades]KAG7099034.1 hypothetical protein E1B28_000914 [Marasmius oreades]